MSHFSFYVLYIAGPSLRQSYLLDEVRDVVEEQNTHIRALQRKLLLLRQKAQWGERDDDDDDDGEKDGEREKEDEERRQAGRHGGTQTNRNCWSRPFF